MGAGWGDEIWHANRTAVELRTGVHLGHIDARPRHERPAPKGRFVCAQSDLVAGAALEEVERGAAQPRRSSSLRESFLHHSDFVVAAVCVR